MVPVGEPTGTFTDIEAMSQILHFAVSIQGFIECILHLEQYFLDFTDPIQGFDYHILKFMFYTQFALEMVPVGYPTGTFTVIEAMSQIHHIAVSLKGYIEYILHLEHYILDFTDPIQGFDHYILKFAFYTQFD